MLASLFLLLDDVRLGQFRISLKCTPGLGSEERAGQVGEIAARPPILEQNQEWHSQRGHNEFHKDVERHPEHMRVAAHEVGKEIHQRCRSEHENQVLKLETQKRHLSVKVAMHRRKVETHWLTLPLHALA